MAKEALLRRVDVQLGDRSYRVVVGSGILEKLGELTAAAIGRATERAFLVIDDGVPAEIARRVAASLAQAGFGSITEARVHPAETDKTLRRVEAMLVGLADSRHERGDPVVALGGGVTGDMAGFAAAIYRRGAPVIQCPTTLLAMVDASVGGKTGVNLRGNGAELRKNMVGAFHQPRAVIADVATLASLPDRVLRAGLAECLKHGMLSADFGDPGLFDWTTAAIPAILRRDGATLTELVARNVTVKAAVVAGDEREEAGTDGRALLNLGHTFGHAIETIPGLVPVGAPTGEPMQHGEAVALGLMASCVCSERIGLASQETRKRIEAALCAAGLPTSIRGLPPAAEVYAAMEHDKKVRNGRLRLVLPGAPGRCRVVDGPPPAAVLEAIDAIRA